LFNKTGSLVIKNDRDEASFKTNFNDVSLADAAELETFFFGLRQVVLAGSQLLLDPMFTSRLSRSIAVRVRQGSPKAEQPPGKFYRAL
jgi:hypothetical protein